MYSVASAAKEVVCHVSCCPFALLVGCAVCFLKMYFKDSIDVLALKIVCQYFGQFIGKGTDKTKRIYTELTM